MEDEKLWRGVHVSEFQTSLNFPQYPEVVSSDEHTVLIKIPVSVNKIPECYPCIFKRRDFWDKNHVKLPCSEKNITKDQINRWNLIRNALSSRILSSQQFQEIVLSCNKRYAQRWNFSALHLFFNEVCEEFESKLFFNSLLPKIIELALCLPELITSGIPLLKRGYKHSITLSQLQISCLLSNAFLCTFPHRNSTKKDSEYIDYPDINFNRLFQCENEERINSIHEKLKCILNYFRRVTTSVPTGVVTYSRQFVPNNIYPNWEQSNKKLPKLYVSSSGTIEDDGFGLFQVDFANKFVGGGVIGTGCVQEEIRFVICPELILSRLFTECLSENEALVVTGCERFNKYKGYGQSFEWDGDYIDETPSDKYGRKYCTIIALDALHYWQNPYAQYLPKNILRDINKAYVGFSWGSHRKKEELCAVATGNWGCGIFRGNPQLKSFLQLMAAAEVNRNLAYFTFGDTELRDSMASVHKFLCDNEVTVGKLYNILLEYNDKQLYETIDLFEFFRTEICRISIPKTECDIPQSNSRNSFGIPKLDITKRSFCCRTKINDWFNPLNKFEHESSEDINKKGFKDVEKELKLKEAVLFSNMYLSAADIESNKEEEHQHHEPDCFDFLNKFKKSLRKNSNTFLNCNRNLFKCDNDLKTKISDEIISNSSNDIKFSTIEGKIKNNLNLELKKNPNFVEYCENDDNNSASIQISLPQIHLNEFFQKNVDKLENEEKDIYDNGSIKNDRSETDEIIENKNYTSECENIRCDTNVITNRCEDHSSNNLVNSLVKLTDDFIKEKFKKENQCIKFDESDTKISKTSILSTNHNEFFNKDLFSSDNILKNSTNVRVGFSKKRKISDYFNPKNKILNSSIS